MKDLYILGMGVHAGEMVEIVERVNRAKPTWRLRGYIVADPNQVGLELNGFKAVASRARLGKYPNACFVPDNSWPRNARVPAAQLVSLVDPSVFVSRTAMIGRGCVIYPHGYVGLNARLGDYVFCLGGCTISHDDVIEDRVVMASGAMLAGYVHVESDCYLGQGMAVRQNLRIGRASLIGMGAVVIRDVPPNCIMVGNPARRLKRRFPAIR